MTKFAYNVIGVMSGTSLDGIDLIYATYKVDGCWDFKIHFAKTIKYSSEWKMILSQLVNQSMEQLQAIDLDSEQWKVSRNR